MSSKFRFLNPEALSKPPGYTHVVEATAPARLVYVAGQLGLDRSGEVVGEAGDFHAQAVQTFENLKAALAAIGATFDDVVKVNNYLTDMKYLPIFRDVRNSYLTGANKPASTTISISGLARPGALLEVEAVAVLPPAARAKAAGRAKGASRGASKAKGASKSARRATKARRTKRR